MSASLSPLAQAQRFYASSIGKKIVVAISGIVFLLFLPAHAIGNLLVFSGQEALNEYAHFLQTAGHGAMIWVFRLGLLTAFIVHIVSTIHLTRQNRAARSDRYAVKTPMRSTAASRTMMVSGLTILAFVVYHILHYTVRSFHGFADLPLDPHGNFDVYTMVILGFQNVASTIFYIVGISLLCFHLSHGVASVFQTLGLRSDRSKNLFQIVGKAYAVIIWLAFAVVPLSILFGFVTLDK
ncbi:succinate dehydrogenase cytochrome b subunit [Sulfuriroseicoccus oceanibius]|uniref:Succinate dehydrogenase cytochrome b subunit n=1 Tax=Sulfuriroseicoccus oceanibius TaxID=2707525 RepID=A0A6B3LEX9_9BACT|nr:succinate dehydrogenase cytochrome b subunit [Sulfuriroseicoccus oceanibius]QQL45210.1 succinate dehydrogenase cytochrome b subunit [Sulfuriroseicoccus oceanibius]